MIVRPSWRRISTMALMSCLGLAAIGQGSGQNTAPSGTKSQNLAAAVARMARVGSANAPSFSPDGKWVSFISNMSGTPQVWVVPAEGGYPRMITSGDDPVVEAEWSPASDWIGIAIAPGGG